MKARSCGSASNSAVSGLGTRASVFDDAAPAALYVPAKFIPRIHPRFTEVVMFLSTQVVDEGRHVEVFERYTKKLHKIYPVDPLLKGLIDEILTPRATPRAATSSAP